MRIDKRAVAIVAAAAIVFVGGTAAGTVAADLIGSNDIKNDSIKSKDIKNDTIQSKDIKKDTIKQRDLAPGLKDKVNTDANTDVRGSLTAFETSGPTNVVNIGGAFADRATLADTFTLPAGTHLIASDGFFISNAAVATSVGTRLQLAIRGPSPTNADFGTCFTGPASILANREATCSTTRVITLTQPTQVRVFVFGYDDLQGSSDSGRFNAFTAVSVVRLN